MNRTTIPRILTLGSAAVLWVAASALPAAAQEDARWLPLTGCWLPVTDLDLGIVENSEAELLCVSTNAEGGVDMHSYQGSELLGTVSMIADGQGRSVEREGCTGTESAQFAEDRRFITVETSYVCDGEVEGRTAGLIAMVTPFEWINAQVVEADDGEVAGVMRYTLASQVDIERAGLEAPSADRANAVQRARISAARPLDVGDVIAASRTVHPQTLQAWVVEQGDLLPVTSDELIRMSDAGVSEDVIDMVVAVSHPTRFAIRQGGAVTAEQDSRRDGYDRRRRRLGFFPGSFGYLGWTRYGYGSGYGYGLSPYSYSSLYGYGGYGYGSGYGYGYPGYRPVIVIPRQPTGNRGGRAINGRGYTRGTGGSDTGRRVNTGTQSTGGSSAATSRGSSSGRSTPRKAKRRGGGSEF